MTFDESAFYDDNLEILEKLISLLSRTNKYDIINYEYECNKSKEFTGY